MNEFHGRWTHLTRSFAGCKTSQAATGADPDGAVRFSGKALQIAVVPNQAVVMVVLSPVCAVPDPDALIGARPQAAVCIEPQGITHFPPQARFSAEVGHRE